VIAVPVTPKTVSNELQSSKRHFLGKERCIFCDMIQQEIETGERIVALTEGFVAFCPYASRFPFEVFVAPRNHSHSFAETPPDELRGLAEILREVIGRLTAGLKNPPFNYMFHSAPNTMMKPRRPGYWSTVEYDYHWHIEILPRLTRIAGFEWGTGFYINPVPPEQAAAHLRSTDPTPYYEGESAPPVDDPEETG